MDDEPSVLMTYLLILEKRGFAVHTAQTSTEAIRMVEQNTYDLLLCDYSLEQEHTGFEVIQVARKRAPQLAAVLLTGYASQETVEYAQSHNVTVLFKPIDIDEFFRTVENLKRGNNAETSEAQVSENKQKRSGTGGKKGRAATSNDKD